MQVYVPGSVTTIFVPQPKQREEGSLGVSFAIEDGVVAEIEESSETSIRLDGDPTAFEPVEIALRELGVTVEVSLTSELPVGYGFGASGTATLATVLAANDALELEQSREELVEVAHYAEVEAGTGLGDVFIQSLGGLVWNVGDGVERVGLTDPIEYTAFAGIETSEALSDTHLTEQISDLSEDILAKLSAGSTMTELLELSWEFARRTDVAISRVIEEVARVKRAGGTASMAMLGETVIATDVQGALENSTYVTPQGARLL